MRAFILCIAIPLLALCAACGANDATVTPSTTLTPIGVEVGNTAPDFTLRDTAGTTITLSSLRGRVVLIDFWGTWCTPCLASLPNLQGIWKAESAKPFTIVSIAVSQNSADWIAFLRKNDLGWKEVLDPENRTAASYQVVGIPSTFLLDRNGTIVARNLSGSMLADSVAKLLR